MAGIERQDVNFWDYIREFDYIGLCETWLDENGWNRIKDKLPDTHTWKGFHAKKEKKKGRAKGGILIGKIKGWGKSDDMKNIVSEVGEGIIITKIVGKKDNLNIFMIYKDGANNDLVERLRDITEEYENERIIIGGDFNIRIGEIGKIDLTNSGIERKSKDKKIGNGGKKLTELIKEKGWYILNGSRDGDWEGEYTYVGARGNTVIDYTFVNEHINDYVTKFYIGERVDSDHMPMITEITTEEENDTRLKKKEEEEETEREVNKDKKIYINWSKEAKEEYREKTEIYDKKWENDASTIDEKWENLKEFIKNALIYKEVRKQKKRKLGYKDWWDRSCTKKKREVKRKYRRWKKGAGRKEEYIEEKKNLREMLEKKRKEKREEEMKELKSLKKEKDVWNFINKKRKKRTTGENNIKKEEWKKYFLELLEGSEGTEAEKEREKAPNKNMRRSEDEEKGNKNDTGKVEKDLTEEEIIEAVRNLKIGKAAGIDEIPAEAWRYGGTAIKKELIKIIKQIWKENKIPTEWRTSIVVPLYKRGDRNNTKNYRGISLLCAAYKIYAEIIRKRLEEEIERGDLLPASQAGFRKGRATTDNIFVLNHLIQREKTESKEEKKIYAIFIDLKAAFDNVDREKLWNIMEEKKVERGLLKRIKEIYKDTMMTIRTKEGLTTNFKTRKGVRQGCVLSPALFSLYIADLDKELELRNIGGLKLGRIRVWSLAYADDMVLVAKNKEALKDMLDSLKRFLKERKLELNAEKTKILIFNKRGRKVKSQNEWKWGKENIEEVENFKYLGFTFNNRGNYEDHIKELKTKGKIAANKIWGLGERICKDDFKRRWYLFKYLVKSVMEYGVEIWGWDEKKELEKIMFDYIRWVFKLDFCTPRYIIEKELCIKKMRVDWGIRAIRYEDKCREKDERNLVKICWEEKDNIYMKEGKKDTFSEEREKFYNNLGWGIDAISMLDRGEGCKEDVIKRRMIDIQGQNIDSKINKAKYNTRYKKIEVKIGKPNYLINENLDRIDKGDSIRALLRLRCGNMEGTNRYWTNEKDKVCKFCENGKDNMDHFVKECEFTKEWFRVLGNNNVKRMETLFNEELDNKKGRILKKLWKEKEAVMKKDKKEE